MPCACWRRATKFPSRLRQNRLQDTSKEAEAEEKTGGVKTKLLLFAKFQSNDAHLHSFLYIRICILVINHCIQKHQTKLGKGTEIKENHSVDRGKLTENELRNIRGDSQGKKNWVACYINTRGNMTSGCCLLKSILNRLARLVIYTTVVDYQKTIFP